MRVKICGITKLEQGAAIANLGATALGFICVPPSPRYLTPSKLKAITTELPSSVDRIGVFADAKIAEIVSTVSHTALTGVQLHGQESPAFCQQLSQALPQMEIIKALRIKSPASLTQANAYTEVVDTLLLDAYHPQLLGGTGKTIDWSHLTNFKPQKPWILAGGLTPDNILAALQILHPHGIDLSSGVEKSPGDKDLKQVALLFAQLKNANFV